jgi:NAD(P)H-hydrate epimerase
MRFSYYKITLFSGFVNYKRKLTVSSIYPSLKHTENLYDIFSVSFGINSSASGGLIKKMKSVTAGQMKEIDIKAQRFYGIPPIILMENAGIQVACQARNMLKNKYKRVCIFCGRGNNGGDGFVAARHLYNEGFKTRVFLIGEYKGVKEDARVNLDILLKMGLEVYGISHPFSRLFICSRRKNHAISGPDGVAALSMTQLKPRTKVRRIIEGFINNELRRASLIIDAIFGIGLNGEVPSDIAELIRIINASKKPILSIDIPSGLNADTGEIMGECVNATKTVTLGLPKKGFFKNKGPSKVGSLSVSNISIPRNLYIRGQ